MKPIRVLSPIEPGELCWVRVDGEWWLVRAEGGDCECCLFQPSFDTSEICRYVCGRGLCFSRVHPIPMPAEFSDFKASDIYKVGGQFFLSDGPNLIAQIGPPEE